MPMKNTLRCPHCAQEFQVFPEVNREATQLLDEILSTWKASWESGCNPNLLGVSPRQKRLLSTLPIYQQHILSRNGTPQVEEIIVSDYGYAVLEVRRMIPEHEFVLEESPG